VDGASNPPSIRLVRHINLDDAPQYNAASHIRFRLCVLLAAPLRRRVAEG
jgi:hypothetical protein